MQKNFYVPFKFFSLAKNFNTAIKGSVSFTNSRTPRFSLKAKTKDQNNKLNSLEVFPMETKKNNRTPEKAIGLQPKADNSLPTINPLKSEKPFNIAFTSIAKKPIYTAYSKADEIKLVTIGIASANRIRQWAEKTLPSGKVVGEVTNANTLHHKTFKPQKGGLFCERIFGPLKDFECSCGGGKKVKTLKNKKRINLMTDKASTYKKAVGLKTLEALLLSQTKKEMAVGLKQENSKSRNPLKSGVGMSSTLGVAENKLGLIDNYKRFFCEKCDVEYTWSVIRRYQLGYIKLNAPVTHVWYVKGNPSYISLLLDMPRRDLISATYSSGTLTIENSLKGDQFYTLSDSPNEIFAAWEKVVAKTKVDQAPDVLLSPAEALNIFSTSPRKKELAATPLKARSVANQIKPKGFCPPFADPNAKKGKNFYYFNSSFYTDYSKSNNHSSLVSTVSTKTKGRKPLNKKANAFSLIKENKAHTSEVDLKKGLKAPKKTWPTKVVAEPNAYRSKKKRPSYSSYKVMVSSEKWAAGPYLKELLNILYKTFFISLRPTDLSSANKKGRSSSIRSLAKQTLLKTLFFASYNKENPYLIDRKSMAYNYYRYFNKALYKAKPVTGLGLLINTLSKAQKKEACQLRPSKVNNYGPTAYSSWPFLKDLEIQKKGYQALLGAWSTNQKSSKIKNFLCLRPTGSPPLNFSGVAKSFNSCHNQEFFKKEAKASLNQKKLLDKLTKRSALAVSNPKKLSLAHFFNKLLCFFLQKIIGGAFNSKESFFNSDIESSIRLNQLFYKKTLYFSNNKTYLMDLPLVDTDKKVGQASLRAWPLNKAYGFNTIKTISLLKKKPNPAGGGNQSQRASILEEYKAYGIKYIITILKKRKFCLKKLEKNQALVLNYIKKLKNLLSEKKIANIYLFFIKNIITKKIVTALKKTPPVKAGGFDPPKEGSILNSQEEANILNYPLSEATDVALVAGGSKNKLDQVRTVFQTEFLVRLIFIIKSIKCDLKAKHFLAENSFQKLSTNPDRGLAYFYSKNSGLEEHLNSSKASMLGLISNYFRTNPNKIFLKVIKLFSLAKFFNNKVWPEPMSCFSSVGDFSRPLLETWKDYSSKNKKKSFILTKTIYKTWLKSILINRLFLFVKQVWKKPWFFSIGSVDKAIHKSTNLFRYGPIAHKRSLASSESRAEKSATLQAKSSGLIKKADCLTELCFYKKVIPASPISKFQNKQKSSNKVMPASLPQRGNPKLSAGGGYHNLANSWFLKKISSKIRRNLLKRKQFCPTLSFKADKKFLQICSRICLYPSLLSLNKSPKSLDFLTISNLRSLLNGPSFYNTEVLEYISPSFNSGQAPQESFATPLLEKHNNGVPLLGEAYKRLLTYFLIKNNQPDQPSADKPDFAISKISFKFLYKKNQPKNALQVSQANRFLKDEGAKWNLLKLSAGGGYRFFSSLRALFIRPEALIKQKANCKKVGFFYTPEDFNNIKSDLYASFAKAGGLNKKNKVSAPGGFEGQVFVDRQKPVPSKFVNNIYCLSHRKIWYQEKDSQFFALYYFANPNLEDKAVPIYDYRNYDFSLLNTLFSKEETNGFLNKTNFRDSNFSFKSNRRLEVDKQFLNVSFSGAGIIQKLLAEFDYFELKKMDKQNRILLYDLNKYVRKLKNKKSLSVNKAKSLSKDGLRLSTWQKKAVPLIKGRPSSITFSATSLTTVGQAQSYHDKADGLKPPGEKITWQMDVSLKKYNTKNKKLLVEVLKQKDALIRRTKLIRKIFRNFIGLSSNRTIYGPTTHTLGASPDFPLPTAKAQNPSNKPKTTLSQDSFLYSPQADSEVLGLPSSLPFADKNQVGQASIEACHLNSMILTLLPVLPPDLRPIVKMGNQIAASDLNRLYQRVIYRNDRLKKFLKDAATNGSYEMKYAQRLLQEAVDNLIQNGKSGVVPEKDSRGRALKSLSDLLKGKQGRFRQYLLGKRVDYSGRSVIVVGPKLKLHECGIPKEMALELYLPFLIKRILNQKLARTVIGAKALIYGPETHNKPLVWSLLREIMKTCPVLLNRAPTLHRLGFQAFQPKLVEGRAILLHPLTCSAFNADFDGDQMAVHIPISVEARTEAWKLMLSRNNLLSPATGEPLALPSQDMVLGCYYLTTNSNTRLQMFEKGFGLYFDSLNDVLRSYNQGKVSIHAVIWVKWNGLIENNNDLEQPLEIRIDKIGYSQMIYAKTQLLYVPSFVSINTRKPVVGKADKGRNTKIKLVNRVIRTTPGKILFNYIIQQSLS